MRQIVRVNEFLHYFLSVLDFLPVLYYNNLVAGDACNIYGGIAQLARVLGSYPIGRWFESYCRYHMARWSRG